MKLRHLFEQEEMSAAAFMADCADWLMLIHGSNQLAYHGSKENIATFDRVAKKRKRDPKNTPDDIHREVNDIFEKKFGWRAREDGLFVTGNYGDANHYGAAYAVFPIGDFIRTLWSPDIEDMTGEWNDLLDGAQAVTWKERREITKAQFMQSMKREYRWHFNSHVVEGLKSGNEMIISADEYYFVNTHSDWYKNEIEPALKRDGILK